MDPERFDELSRTLAATPSRRQVLRGIVASLGALLAASQGGDAAAASCGTFCNTLPPGRERGQCARSCARDRSLIDDCGGDPSRLCFMETGPICCGADQVCEAGTCTCPEACPPGLVRLRASCGCGIPCTSLADCPAGCGCSYVDVYHHGSSVCHAGGFLFELDFCDEVGCPPGYGCVLTPGGYLCAALCPA